MSTNKTKLDKVTSLETITGLADQTEAEAGSSNVKLMTALRTAQAIATAVWQEDFGGFPVASGLPPGWTSRWVQTNVDFSIQAEGISGSVSGRELKFTTASANARRLATFDSAGISEDVEILISGYCVAVPANQDGGVCAVVRASGAAGTESGYIAYQSSTSAAGEHDHFRLLKYVAGAVTVLATANFNWAANTRYYVRLRAIGTSIKAKIWATTDSEPGSWNIEVTDSSVTSGMVGVFDINVTADSAYDFISVAYDGETAQLPSDAFSRTSHAISSGIANRPAAPTVQVFAAPGTWTRPAGCRAIKVTVIGGGGGGGRGTPSSIPSPMPIPAITAGSSGGGGGWARKWFPDVTPPAFASLPVTSGDGGTGQTAPGTAATAGGPSAFGPAPSPTAVVATGGGLGAAFPAAGGAGGPATGGDINIAGLPGVAGTRASLPAGAAGALMGMPGGHSHEGGGGLATISGSPNTPGSGAGGPGEEFGGGGASGVGAPGNTAGGDGGDGVVIVEEFY